MLLNRTMFCCSMRSLCKAAIAVYLAGALMLGCSQDKEPKQDKQQTGNVQEIKNLESEVNEPVDGDWLISVMSAEPDTLNPVIAMDAYEGMVNKYVYESLVERDKKTLELKPELAESWEISEDRLEYTFYLEEGVRFHDGRPLTAHDLKFTLDRIMDPEVDAPHLRNYYRDIKEVNVLDDFTIKFTYARPYFLALEVLGGIPAMPRHIFESGNFNNHPNNRRPVGSGPYKFVEWDTGMQIVLARNEDYWGKKPNLERIVFNIITDSTVALQVLKKGNIDIMGLTPIQWVKQTKGSRFDEKFRKISYSGPGYNFIAWNARKPYFSDKRVRIAMTHLVDREKILATINFGLGKIVTGNFWIDSPYYNHNIKPITYDPARAKELLDEAGWADSDNDGIRDKDGTKFSFEFLISGSSQTAEQLSTILKEDLKNMGIEMSIRKLEWAVFTQHLNDRKFDATTLGWSLGVEADPYQIWHSSQAEKGSNFVGFINEEADDIIDKARVEFDKEKRIELYRRFHEIIHEEQPYTFLFNNKSLVAVHKRFMDSSGGITVYPLGLEPLEWFVPLKLQRY